MAEATPNAQLALLVERLLETAQKAVEGLTVEQLCAAPQGKTNSIGWDVWHVVRTADNVIHFVFDRAQPVWLQGGFHEKWGLPKVEQGTGMPEADAYALHFPEPAEFNRYTKAVAESVVPRIRGMSLEYLSEITTLRPWGDVPRMEAIGQVLVAHGNGHLGRVSMARSLLGLEGLGY
jgi:hypothetical protein